MGIVGCESGAYRSDVAADLAIGAAECCTQSVLLIDADEQHRNVAERFGLNGSPGWREVLAGTADAQSCVHKANEGKLAVMTCGQPGGGPRPPQVSTTDSQLNELKHQYGFVVVDMPTGSVTVLGRGTVGWTSRCLLSKRSTREFSLRSGPRRY